MSNHKFRRNDGKRRPSAVAELEPLERQLLHTRMTEACRRMLRSLKRTPEPRWYWTHAEQGRHLPWKGLVRMIDAAAANGAPIEDVLAPVKELEAYILAKYPCTLPALETLQELETARQGVADQSQLALARNGRCRIALARAEEWVRAHYTTLGQLLERISHDRRDIENQRAHALTRIGA
jgi:hypothetical protein